MIKFENVSYTVRDGLKNEKNIINDISFTLPNSGLVALVGPSGSGKTTILNLILKTINNTSGSIIFNEFDYNKCSVDDLDKIRSNYLSVVFQDLQLFNDLTIYENIELAFKIKGRNVDLDLYNKYISMLKLDNVKDEIVYNLSGGEKQRVAILRAIITSPKTILLDEPTASLDKKNSVIVMDFLKEISKEILVLFSSHNLDLVNEYATNIISLDYGEIIKNTLNIDIEDCSILEKREETKESSSVNYIRKKIFHKQGIKSVFSTILLSISLILLVIPFWVFSYNKYSFTYRAYKKTGYDTFLVSSSYGDILKDYNFDKYSNLEKRDYYYNALNSSRFPNIGSSVVIDDDLEDYGIIITDYIEEYLNNKNLIKDNYVTYGDYNLKIVSVKKTNYKKYEKISSENKKQYYDFFEYYYNNVYMSTFTASVINDAVNGYKSLNINNVNFQIKTMSNISNNKFYNDTTKLNDDEIILNSIYYTEILGIQRDSTLSDTLKGMIGSKVTFLGNEYTIKDVMTVGGATDIFVSDNTYKEIKGNLTFSTYYKYTSININNKKDFINLLKDMDKSEYKFKISFESDLYFCTTQIEEIRYYSRYIIPLALILFIISGLLTSYMIVEHNKRRFAISLTLGMSFKTLLKILCIEILKIVGISSLIAFISYLYFYFKYNINVMNETSIDFFVNRFEITGIILYFLIMALVVVLTVMFMAWRFRKRDLKDNIYR